MSIKPIPLDHPLTALILPLLLHLLLDLLQYPYYNIGLLALSLVILPSPVQLLTDAAFEAAIRLCIPSHPAPKLIDPFWLGTSKWTLLSNVHLQHPLLILSPLYKACQTPSRVPQLIHLLLKLPLLSCRLRVCPQYCCQALSISITSSQFPEAFHDLSI